MMEEAVSRQIKVHSSTNATAAHVAAAAVVNIIKHGAHTQALQPIVASNAFVCIGNKKFV